MAVLEGSAYRAAGKPRPSSCGQPPNQGLSMVGDKGMNRAAVCRTP